MRNTSKLKAQMNKSKQQFSEYIEITKDLRKKGDDPCDTQIHAPFEERCDIQSEEYRMASITQQLIDKLSAKQGKSTSASNADLSTKTR